MADDARNLELFRLLNEMVRSGFVDLTELKLRERGQWSAVDRDAMNARRDHEDWWEPY
jgi:hypothetical protein